MTPEGTQPQISIRRMRLEDVGAVVAIDQSSFSMPWTERTYRFEINGNPNAVAWVAEQVEGEQSRIVGMIVSWLVVDEAHVGTIAIHPDFRHLGIGRRLLATCLLDLAARGAKNSLLEVRRGNTVAQHLYERFGYETVGIRKRYYHDNGEDALLMTLKHLDAEQIRMMLK